jgi:hypothetical protein
MPHGLPGLAAAGGSPIARRGGIAGRKGGRYETQFRTRESHPNALAGIRAATLFRCSDREIGASLQRRVIPSWNECFVLTRSIAASPRRERIPSFQILKPHDPIHIAIRPRSEVSVALASSGSG